MSCWILDRIMPFSKFLYYLCQYLPLWSLFLFTWIIKFMNLYLLSTVLYFTKSRMCCAHSKCSINIVSWMRMLLFQHVTHSRYLYFTTGIERLIWRMQWWEKVGKCESKFFWWENMNEKYYNTCQAHSSSIFILLSYLKRDIWLDIPLCWERG